MSRENRMETGNPLLKKQGMKNSRRSKSQIDDDGWDWCCSDDLKIWWLLGGCLCLPLLILIISMLVTSIHFIEEGNAGVYFRYGALQNVVGIPGLNIKAPFVTSHQQIRIRPASDILEKFTAVTKDAIPITFHDVEVISSVSQGNVIWLVRRFGSIFRTVLVFDRLKEEIRRHCLLMRLMKCTTKTLQRCQISLSAIQMRTFNV